VPVPSGRKWLCQPALLKELMKIVPITAQQINWQDYINLVMEVTDESPTRCLDVMGIGLTSLVSFLATLGLDNDSTKQLETINPSYGLVHFAFLVSDPPNIYQLLNMCGLFFYEKSGLLFIGGNLLQWFAFIRLACTREQKPPVRKIGNEVLDYFERANIRAFKYRDRLYTSDGTYTLT
jgi:hypothetical protein